MGGFLFDVFMVGRADAWHTIVQQAVYLAAVTGALVQMLRETLPPRPWWAAARSAATHFLLGTLLNIYTIFYFKSSSLLVSSGFLALIVVLLLANESRRFAAFGLPFKFALLALCWLSFSALTLPIAIGSIGTGVFLACMAAGALPLAAVGVVQARRREILVPLGVVLAGFLLFYLFRLIPPVPLSIPYMGVYHSVERTREGFRLAHQRPAWRIWHHGDQHFAAQPGDRVHVYFRVFSPTRFSDEVWMRWYRREDAAGWIGGWTPTDHIPIRIVGGREAGFRGYGFKANWQPGAWRVLVETADGREIGRIYFTVEAAAAGPRAFIQELD